MNQIVLITGGCSGIGKAAAFLFAKEGAKIFLADLSEKLGDEMVEALEKEGVEAAFARIDVTDFHDVERMVEECINKFGGIDVLVNSAGILGPRTRTDRYPNEDFQQVMNVNVNGVFYAMKAVLPHFLSKKSGVIVNLASVAGILGFANHSAYDASKHAVIGLTKTTALEFAKHGIRINAVCPAFTSTPMMENALMNDESNYFEALQNAIPMKRFAQPDEIAKAIVYAASPAASFMTGHSLVLDGGLVVS
jgi:NAD(P)-dependent dehydrogenase (short-subunit alcohol dehydrogenase family)